MSLQGIQAFKADEQEWLDFAQGLTKGRPRSPMSRKVTTLAIRWMHATQSMKLVHAMIAAQSCLLCFNCGTCGCFQRTGCPGALLSAYILMPPDFVWGMLIICMVASNSLTVSNSLSEVFQLLACNSHHVA